MTGGLKETASRLAIAALFCVLGSAVFGQKPAKAADLGGDCCADLEERVAELEATTVRKGNKKVSVTVYGKVNKAVEFWDDGAEKNTYVVDNSYESSRFGFKGTAKITGDWSAGYKMEMETTTAASNSVNQYVPGDDPNFAAIFVRHSYMFVADKQLGELRWGLTSMPKDDIVKDTDVTDLEDTMFSDNMMNRSFFLRPKGFNTESGLSPNVQWRDISDCYSQTSDAYDCSTRRNAVTWWSPTWNGFTLSAGWGEDDIWGGALRYKNQWGNAFLVGAGAAYEKTTDERENAAGGGLAGFHRDIDDWAGDGSIKHLPTGLFLFTAWSLSDDHSTNSIGVFDGKRAPDMTAWDVRVGIQRKMGWLGSLGDTSLFGGYLDIKDGLGFRGNDPSRFLGTGSFANVAVPTEIVGADVNRWYLGYDQAIDSAALHIYGVYQHLNADVDLVDSSLNRVAAPLDGFDLFYTGARIYF
jgi:predicted porin